MVVSGFGELRIQRDFYCRKTILYSLIRHDLFFYIYYANMFSFQGVYIEINEARKKRYRSYDTYG